MIQKIAHEINKNNTTFVFTLQGWLVSILLILFFEVVNGHGVELKKLYWQ